MNKLTKHLISATFLLFFLLLAFGSDESNTSNAKAQISNINIVEDIGIINNEPDAGYAVTFTVKNIGEYGEIIVNPRLSCSEGEWNRKQTLILNKGESRNLKYFFHEPTINSTNAQVLVYSR